MVIAAVSHTLIASWAYPDELIDIIAQKEKTKSFDLMTCDLIRVPNLAFFAEQFVETVCKAIPHRNELLPYLDPFISDALYMTE